MKEEVEEGRGAGVTRIPLVIQTACQFTARFVLHQEHDSILHNLIQPYNDDFAKTL